MQELLEILRCPETHQRFAIADDELIGRLNEAIKSGQLKNRADKPVTTLIESGLVREDRKFVYPVRAEIPVLLIDEAIPIE